MSLSADESTYIYLDNEDYDLVSLQEKPALFTEDRCHACDIPKGMYSYFMKQHSPNEPFGSVTALDQGNIAGTVITQTPIVSDDRATYIFKTQAESVRFTGSKATLKEYRDGKYNKKAYEALNAPATSKQQNEKNQNTLKGR